MSLSRIPTDQDFHLLSDLSTSPSPLTRPEAESRYTQSHCSQLSFNSGDSALITDATNGVLELPISWNPFINDSQDSNPGEFPSVPWTAETINSILPVGLCLHHGCLISLLSAAMLEYHIEIGHSNDELFNFQAQLSPAAIS